MEKNTKLRMSAARQISYERIAKGLSQQELADIVGTTKSGISRIESGKQNITMDYAAAIAEALGLEASFQLHEDVTRFIENETSYDLKLYDEVLCSFTLSRDLDIQCTLTYINEKKKNLLPLDLQLTGEGMLQWLQRRSIPKNREFCGNILHSLGLHITDVKGIIDICMGLSLNDSYWITAKGFEGGFDSYNLYENPFDEALSLIAYTGGMYSTEGFRTSPELTTQGMLRKAWRFSKIKGICLYKGGTMDFANAGNEPYCEFYASQIAEKMGLHAVKYELENWKGILASKCLLFTDKDTSYIPIGYIQKNGGIAACIEYYKSLGDRFYQELASMLVFDAVIFNEDRHFGNFGVLRDNRNGRIISPAPIFDNGASLLCYAMESDFRNSDLYLSTHGNPYGPENDAVALAKRVMGPLQRSQLRRLIGFRFAESNLSNLPRRRLEAMENLVQSRVKELLTGN